MSDDRGPLPGSDEAITMGCTCPVLDNCHGAGFPYAGQAQCFYISGDCPIHAKKEDRT